jgi:hypothetical protein
VGELDGMNVVIKLSAAAIRIDGGGSPMSLLRRKQPLYRLFCKLATDFNGNLFSDDLAPESALVSAAHIAAVGAFFRGTDVKSGQQASHMALRDRRNLIAAGRKWDFYAYLGSGTVSTLEVRRLGTAAVRPCPGACSSR